MNLSEKRYEAFLSQAPKDHNSPEFVEWMKENNKIVLLTPEWLVVENVKYHTKQKPWYTAFDLRPDMTLEYKLQALQWEFPEWKMLIHPKIVQSIRRYHVHLLRVDTSYLVG